MPQSVGGPDGSSVEPPGGDALTRSRRDAGQDAVLAAVADAAGPHRAEVAVDFARVALRRMPAEELRAGNSEALAARLVDAFHFADARNPDEIAIRVVPADPAVHPGHPHTTLVEVSTEDRPFLLATVTEEVDHLDVGIVQTLHPIVGVRRDEDGRIGTVEAARSAERRESYILIELDRVLDGDEAADLEAAIRRDVEDVFAATADFDAMRRRIEEVVELLPDEVGGHVDEDEVEETTSLLEWLLDGNFILLGVREYEIVPLDEDHPAGPGEAVRLRPDSGLGILRREGSSSYTEPVPVDDLPAEQRRRLLGGPLLTISRTNRTATVQRHVRMDYVGLKRLREDGTVGGEFRLLGLFTRKAVTEPARTTPVLRQKLRRILEREDVVPGSHDEATLISLFQALPKDELFQADVDTLHELIVDLFHAEEHRQVRVAVRVEEFTRTVSVLMAVPQERYDAEVRRRFTEVLLDRYDAEHVDVDLSLGDRREALARFSVRLRDDADVTHVPVAELERAVRRLTRTWEDEVDEALASHAAPVRDPGRIRQLSTRLPGAYRESTRVDAAVHDLLTLDQLVSEGDPLLVGLRPSPGRDDLVRLKAYRQGEALELSAFLPILEHLGLTVVEELPYTLTGDGPPLHIHDFGVRSGPGSPIDVAADDARLSVAILSAWSGQTESDSLNRLVLSAGLDWWQVAILRAYRRYRRQVGTAYTPEYVNDALVSHAPVARRLVEYFEMLFDPDVPADEDRVAASRQAVVEACDAVERLDHDRILRSFLSLIDATLRTNVFRADAASDERDGKRLPYLSFKFASERVPDAPKPVPYREIFVYSPRVEGIHLRGGPVARGGLRWSDRQDDVRTEVLGLMKAQMLKNAVIVPTGAKGGFVLKQPPADPSELRAEVEQQYITFIRGLLDLTDDLDGGTVRPPPQVVRRDGDDPYLVVAADRGTATFSDTANEVARSYGFWLGDAFASGGSQGYDHKALGITARGTWVAVRRHFHELGVDPEAEPVSVVGIGDMSGDVFGNGLLSSRTLRLVAAFDHRDIFLDPDPDPEASFEERERLFTTSGATWQDYRRDRLSEGGGVFPRSQKRIELTPQVRDVLRIEAEVLSPPELIQAILRAPVDLLWAGGIGTYVKASTESHDDIGDRVNDELRVDADEVRARVFAEGANLSITQRGRIQYARRGGRIDQDAIHNAGGVDISDHEVNLKILLRAAAEEGRVVDEAERDELLERVTPDVVAHVLRDVELQTVAISQEVQASPQRLDAYEHLMSILERGMALDRDVEALPDHAEIDERREQGAGLTRPELATLLGYAKRLLVADVLSSGLPDDPAVAPIVEDYFPEELVKRFGDLLPRHRLHRELVATLVANDVVNRMGVTFAFRLATELGVERPTVLAAYWASRQVSQADRAWRGVEGLDDWLAPERQLEVKGEIDRLVAELTRAYSDDPELPHVDRIVARDRPTFDRLRSAMMDIGSSAQRSHRRERARRLIDDLVEEELAGYAASTRDLAMVPAVARVVRDLSRDPDRSPAVAEAFLRLADELAIDRLGRQLDRIEPAGRWSRYQHGGLAADLRSLRADAVRAALDEEPSLPELEAADRFLHRREASFAHAVDLVRDVEAEEHPSLDAIAVAVRGLRDALERRP